MAMLSEVISPTPALLGQGTSLPELANRAQQQPGADYERMVVERGAAHVIAVPGSSHIYWHASLGKHPSCRM